MVFIEQNISPYLTRMSNILLPMRYFYRSYEFRLKIVDKILNKNSVWDAMIRL